MLEAAGSSIAHVVKATVLLAGLAVVTLRTVHPAGQSFAQAGAKEKFVATLTKVVDLVR